MADVAPFRAVRYANPTAELTAPPYDVLTPEQRDVFRARDPHNVVHLTLNHSEDEAGDLFRAWLAKGVLVQDDEPSAWVVAQDYVGPDGIARRREGLVASLAVEPYDARTVLPHERTHAGPRASRLRLLRAARAQLEPIFLLYDGEPPAPVPDREPDLVAADTKLWRIAGEGLPAAFAEKQLLIADGHHRYETALAYADEEGTPESARMMVVLVSTSDPGLEIFPTHRLFRGHDEALPPITSGDSTPPAAAVARLAGQPFDRAHAVGYRPGATFPVVGEAGELDVELVDRLVGHEGLGYSADLDEAVARVDSGEFDGAFLLRATRIEDVFERARRGEVMPQKTTYFFPKLTSGLALPPGMTVDWLSVCRDCVADIDRVLAELPTRSEREPVLRAGEGGDDTTAVDGAAEDAVVARLEALESDFVLVSEELGERVFGAGGPIRVILDPIDGSVNAKRGIPFFSLSFAVADGPTMADVLFGYVYDFGAREEWVAERGGGARLDGKPLVAPPPKSPIEILSFEATTTAYIAERAPALLGIAERLRVMGSLALSLCHLAAGRVDAVCSLKAARSIDIAAAQLLVRERGYAIELFEDPPFASAPLDLVGRSRLVAAADDDVCRTLARALGGG